MFGIKRTLADKLFSDLVRMKADWTCQRCFTKYIPPTQGLHCSHFWGRGNKSVRFDFQNAIAACFSCHQYLGANPHEHKELFLKRLGQKAYDELERRAKTPMKIDEKMMVIAFKETLKRIKSGIIGAR